MSYKASAPAGAEKFETVPAGTHLAVCCIVAYVGWQKSLFNGKEECHPKVVFTWELVNEKMKDGKPFVISAVYTSSLHSKANMRKMLECWRSRPFNKEELAGFDIMKVLGKPCLVSVIHKEVNKDIKARVQAVSATPRGTPAPSFVSPPLYYSVEPHDPDSCDILMLPEWIRKICAAAVPPPNSGETGPPPGQTSEVEDIPF